MDIYFCFSQTEFREGKKIEPIWRKQNECVFCFFKKRTEQTFLCDNFEKSLLMEEAIKIDVVTLLAAVDVVTRNLLIAQSRGQVNWMRARAKLLSSTYPSNANCFNINNIGCRLLFFSSSPSLKAPLIIYIGWVLLLPIPSTVFHRKSLSVLVCGLPLIFTAFPCHHHHSHMYEHPASMSSCCCCYCSCWRLRMDNPLSSSWT